ncbi:MAG: DUF512 domain-containing protein [Ruminococcus sp.]|nr:DUF512 domain-containing protein [Ruminococcus sp.]
MVPIKSVISGSPASACGIAEGDILVSVNGEIINDVLDYMYYSADVNVEIVVLRNGEEMKFIAHKDEYDDLGLEFDTFLMDIKRRCSNKCVFCFIDQMPPNMRETLYFKDDDARLSFLQGNYVTLTNLKDEDIDRIIKMKLNINVSVHTTNPELRVKMMGNRFAGEKLKYIRRLAENGICLNCQIVCCPDLNDGEELRRTLRDLGDLMPNISSMAVVPVGVTKFRENLFPLKTFDKKGAGETIDIIEEFQALFLEKYGTRVVFPSDEFFLTAKRELPDMEYYEDFPQFENGVGMLRSLVDEFKNALEDAEYDGGERHITIATGYCPYPVIKQLCESVENKFNNIKIDVMPIRNDFFGNTITVTGLITAGDLISQLKGRDNGTELLISRSMLMQNSDIFLDDKTISDVENELDIKIKSTQNDGYELLDAILGL